MSTSSCSRRRDAECRGGGPAAGIPRGALRRRREAVGCSGSRARTRPSSVFRGVDPERHAVPLSRQRLVAARARPRIATTPSSATWCASAASCSPGRIRGARRTHRPQRSARRGAGGDEGRVRAMVRERRRPVQPVGADVPCPHALPGSLFTARTGEVAGKAEAAAWGERELDSRVGEAHPPGDHRARRPEHRSRIPRIRMALRDARVRRVDMLDSAFRYGRRQHRLCRFDSVPVQKGPCSP